MARPSIEPSEKQQIIAKLEPYLKMGHSLRKACLMSQVPRSTVYSLIERDPEFLDQITRFQHYLGTLINNALLTELYQIVAKQQKGRELNRKELRFLMWFSLNSGQCREEYGRRVRHEQMYDPEQEIHRLMKIIEETASRN